MRASRRSFHLITMLVAGTGGCFMNHDDPEPVDFEVDAVLSSASLADDCADAGAGDADAACFTPEDCPSFCQQSSIQIAFEVTGEHAQPLAVRVLRVSVLDATTDEHLDEVDAYAPTAFDPAGGYVPWDARLAVPSELQSSFRLTAPDWVSIAGGRVGGAYGRALRLEVEVEVGGEVLTLRSGELYRIAGVDT
jgi:hypothetical protein